MSLVTFIFILILGPIIALIAGKKLALLVVGLWIGWDFINANTGFLGLGGPVPIIECLTSKPILSACSNNQIIGVIIIIGTILITFIPKSKLN